MRSKSLRRLRFGIVGMLCVCALPCLAGDSAVLKNGFSIKHEHREVVGNITRLYLSADGASFVDVPTAEIDHFEAAPDESATRSRPGTRSPLPAAGFPARPVTDLSTVVNEASGKYQLDPDLVTSVIRAESNFKIHAVSPKGAQGLMQLMPGTASQLGVPNAFDAEANVDGGTRYLRELMEKYNFDLVKALAAYNAGPQRVEQFGGVPPYYETRAYVARIVKDFNRKKMAQGRAAAAKKSAAYKRSTAKSNATTAKNKATAADPTNSVKGSE